VLAQHAAAGVLAQRAVHRTAAFRIAILLA
jgi:hypothetical protein